MTPLEPDSRAGHDEVIRDVAARWVIRRDRSFSAGEAAEFAAWLAADPRHERAFEEATRSWQKLGALSLAVRRGSIPATPARQKIPWLTLGGIAAAAVLLLAVVRFERESNVHRFTAPSTIATTASPLSPVIRLLSDGSTVRLNAGAQIEVAFGPAERRVRLVSGEALFEVAKNPERPFLVEVGRVTVRAVGTAFAVRSEAKSVDVLVTEGTVQVTQNRTLSAGSVDSSTPAFVGAGYRATIQYSLQTQAPVVVSAVSATEIGRSLSWAKPMMNMNESPLGEVVAVFSRQSGRKIEIGDPALAATKIGGKFPVDDLDGFLRGLREIYDVRSESTADGGIMLRKGR